MYRGLRAKHVPLIVTVRPLLLLPPAAVRRPCLPQAATEQAGQRPP